MAERIKLILNVLVIVGMLSGAITGAVLFFRDAGNCRCGSSISRVTTRVQGQERELLDAKQVLRQNTAVLGRHEERIDQLGEEDRSKGERLGRHEERIEANKEAIKELVRRINTFRHHRGR